MEGKDNRPVLGAAAGEPTTGAYKPLPPGLRAGAVRESAPLPMPPIELDRKGTARFVSNPLVVFLLEAGPYDMRFLAKLSVFTDEQRAQFAALTGYSVSGWGDLPYVTATQCKAADTVVQALLRAKGAG